MKLERFGIPTVHLAGDTLPLEDEEYNSGVKVSINRERQAIESGFGYIPKFIGPRPKNPAPGYWLPSIPFKRKYRIASPLSYTLVKAVASADIIHWNAYTPLTVSGILEAKRQGKKSIFHVHTQHEEYLRKWCEKSPQLAESIIAMLRPSYRFCLHTADIILTPTVEFAQMVDRQYGVGQKTTPWICPIVLDITASDRYQTDRLIESLDINLNEPQACVITRLGDEKNIIRYLETWAYLAKTRSKVGLTLIGGGEQEKYEALARELGCDLKRLHFTGNLPHGVALALASKLHFAVCFSLYETLCIAALEQMLLGQFLISVENTIPSKYTAASGGIVLPDDPVILANAIMDNCQDIEKIKKRGENARIYVEKNYSQPVQSAKLCGIYKNLVGL